MAQENTCPAGCKCDPGCGCCDCEDKVKGGREDCTCKCHGKVNVVDLARLFTSAVDLYWEGRKPEQFGCHRCGHEHEFRKIARFVQLSGQKDVPLCGECFKPEEWTAGKGGWVSAQAQEKE